MNGRKEQEKKMRVVDFFKPQSYHARMPLQSYFHVHKMCLSPLAQID